jgi:hypothetical protein
MQWTLMSVTAPKVMLTNVTGLTGRLRVITPGSAGCKPTSYSVEVAAMGEGKTSQNLRYKTWKRGPHVTIDVTGMDSGRIYRATITGVCASGIRTPPSAPVIIRALSPALLDTSPTLSFSAETSTSVMLTISPPQAGCRPAWYQIRRSSTGEKAALMTVKASHADAYQLSGLDAGHAYKIVVAGVCTDGSKTPLSEPKTVQTKAEEPSLDVSFTVRTNGTSLDQFSEKVVDALCEQLLSRISYPRGKSGLCFAYSHTRFVPTIPS